MRSGYVGGQLVITRNILSFFFQIYYISPSRNDDMGSQPARRLPKCGHYSVVTISWIEVLSFGRLKNKARRNSCLFDELFSLL